VQNTGKVGNIPVRFKVVLGEHDLLKSQVLELHHEVQELVVVLHTGSVESGVLGIPQVTDDAQLHAMPPV
jgi:hypothetical protein